MNLKVRTFMAFPVVPPLGQTITKVLWRALQPSKYKALQFILDIILIQCLLTCFSGLFSICHLLSAYNTYLLQMSAMQQKNLVHCVKIIFKNVIILFFSM